MLKKIFQRKKSTQTSDLSGLLARQYRQQVDQKNIQHDKAQWLALETLQSLLDNLLAVATYNRKAYLHRLLSPTPVKCQGLYIFGDVGRGKSMLMALFYDACPIEHKRRIHFYIFMLEVHAFIHKWRQQHKSDAITALAKKISGSTKLLCLDEFHVTDIADAMILERLFRQFYELDLVVVMTSNRHPDDLYLGGLQREQFLIFTQLLQKESKIIELIAQTDYRQIRLRATKVSYYFPLDNHADKFLLDNYNKYTNYAKIQSGILNILGRNVTLSSIYGNVALTSFEELCERSLGSVDYAVIARNFSILIMANIPKLSTENRNEAKRFMTLIDVLYEHKVKLLCTAEVPTQELYTEGDGAFEFKRTVSRLIEMQSTDYLCNKHNGH
jgi:cell division protein ZapE